MPKIKVIIKKKNPKCSGITPVTVSPRQREGMNGILNDHILYSDCFNFLSPYNTTFLFD